MSRFYRHLPLLIATLAGCGRCGAKPVALQTPEELLPASTPGLLRAPSLTQLAAAASALAKSLARFPEGEAAQSTLDLWVGQLGFDPRSAAGLKTAGLDGRRPVLVGDDGTHLLAIVPVADEGRFGKTVTRLAADRLGAAAEGGPGGVTLFRGKSGVAALGFRAGYAVLATGEGAADAVGRALACKPEESLAQLPLYRLSMQKLGAGHDAVAWAPAGSPRLPPWKIPGRAFAAGVSFEEGRLQLRAVATLAVPEGIALSALSLPAGQALVADLAPGSPFVLRIGGEPAMLYGAWARLPASARQPAAAAGVDVPTEVLQNLKPGLVLGVGVAPHIDLSAAPTFDPRRQNPFRYVTLDAFASVRDPVKGAATLEKIYAAAPQYGAKVAKRRIGTQDVATFSYEQGEGASVALVGSTLVVTGGEGEMAGALARLAGKSPPYAVPAALERPLKGHPSSGAALDTDALRAAVERIPPTAYSGLTGLTVHALVSRFLEPIELLGPITATLNFDADAITAEAGVTLR